MNFCQGTTQFWTFEQAIERSKKIEPLFAPNTKNKAHYSDANFQLLGKIIENITGSAFAKNCEEIIFQPLNMTKTYIYSDIYDTMPKTLYYKQKALKIPRAMASFGADGGIVSTSQEMLTFIEAFFRGKLFPESYIDDLKVWNKILAPLQSGVGIHRFKLPKITGMPELIGHSGLSGALAYYEPKNDIFVAGTVNQIAYPSTSFTIAAKLIEATLSEKKKKKVETVSAIALGTTYSNIDNNGGNSKIGLSVGVYQEYKILKPLSFTVEIVYNQKGERSDDELANIRLHYLDFPLMARLNLLNNKLGLSSGFSSGILLGSNKEKDAFQRFESSIPFAINYALGDFPSIVPKVPYRHF
jgi:CubicO group peptidase (beta-lactamase class C family)